MNVVLNAFILSLIAGLGTGLGGLLAISRKPGRRSFGLLMGVTAGVMISLSFLGLVNEAWALKGFWTATLGFGAGAFFMLLIDISIPHVRFGESETQASETATEQAGDASPHPGRRRRRRFRSKTRIVDPQLFRSGILLFIGIAIHNIPEGIAVGAGYVHEPKFGLMIAMAILLHNIPEGIATALPLRTSGVGKWESFGAALLSGLVEPIGALMAAALLSSIGELVPGALAFAGGVMVFITLDELIPVARQHGHQHYTAVGIILGSIAVFLLAGFFGL